MSNPEIEDVLSSIRRLVSEDLRPGLRMPAPVAAEPADKLLLTPALRIVDPAPEAAPDSAASQDATPLPVEDVVARLGASVPEEEWESPFGDPEVWPGTLPPPGSLPPNRARADQPGAPEQDPFTSVDDALTAELTDAPLAGFGPDAFDATTEVLPEAEPEPTPRAPRREVSPPPVDSDWADEAEAEVIAELAQDVEEDVLSGLYGRDDAGMVFDEAVLRDLVRDLIREELSGSLGERITRNIRKLVRAEIARALAVREFE
jgi:hypothetical protein